MEATTLWFPATSNANRVITSATLDEGAPLDTVTLYVKGERATVFEVASGLGAKLLTELGMAKLP